MTKRERSELLESFRRRARNIRDSSEDTSTVMRDHSSVGNSEWRAQNSVGMRLQEFFRVHGGHAAGASGGDGLTIMMILNIACGKNTSDVGLASVMCDEIAVGVQVELAVKYFRVGLVADA